MTDQDLKKDLIKEEQGYLDGVIEQMDKELLRLNSQWTEKDLDAKKQKDACLPDTYGALIDDQDDKFWIKNENSYLQQVRDELYGNRLVLEVTDKFDENKEPHELELKIGLHTFVKGEDIFICSWKRPVCREFLMDDGVREYTNIVEDKNGKYETLYSLKQKREITLDFDHVIKAVQLYSDDSEDSDKVVSDEFLQELLSRRTEKEFKNIIFSIQKKQGEIIKKPFNQNIIVQGCAGSGKSMIMLHRLPILLYDNPNSLNIANIYIITPSRSYIQQAQNMLYQLEIAALPMGTLEEYYMHVITKYGRELKECGKKNSFKNLDPDVERYIYSKECIDDIIAIMNGIIGEKYVEYDTGLTYWSLENDSGIKKRLNSINNDTFDEKIRDLLIIYQKIIDVNDESLRQYYVNIRETVNSVKKFQKKILEYKSIIIRVIDKKITEISDDIKKKNKEIEKYNQEGKSKAVNTRKEKLILLTKDYEKNLKIKDEVSQSDEYFSELNQLATELDKALEIYHDIKKDYGKYKKVEELYELVSHINDFSNKVLDIIEKINSLDNPYLSYSDEIIRTQIATKSSILNLMELNIPLLDKEYALSVETSILAYKDLSENLVINVYKEILTRVGEESDKNGNFKLFYYSSYLFLQILFQYQGAPNAQPEALVTIDEAQNLAIEEIYLIKKINNNQVILNLFGDIRQHFENSKGIDEWSEISQIANFQISEMNENYRNARQITKYCNDCFHINMKAINWDGEGYKEFTNLNQYNEEINKILLHPHLEGLCAVIVADRFEAKYFSRNFTNFSSRINDMTASSSPFNEAKWNLMTISQAKGLEFRTVIAISGRMTPNQKYVAFTRALDKLYIFGEVIELSDEDLKFDDEEKEDKDNKKKKTQSVTENKDKKENVETNPDGHKKKKKKFGKEVKMFFEKAGLNVNDERENGGYLWVEGDESVIKEYINEAVDKFEISGRFTNGKRTGWFTKTNK